MTVHFDGDALVYIAGFAADSRNGPFSHSAHNIKLIINKVLKHCDEDEYRIFLTAKDPAVNFRTEVLPSYKKNRSSKCKKCNSSKKSKESYVDRIAVKDGIMKRRFYSCLDCGEPMADSKPVYYNKIRKFLVEQYGALICQWGEADDWLGVRLKPDDIIASHDKDLRMIPCRYYNLKSELLTEHEDPGEIWLDDKRKLQGYGFKWFCVQMLTGDKVDNIIKPYKGDGPVWINKVFGPLKTMRESWEMVKLYYHGTNNDDYLETMSQLLWIARKKHQRGTIETIDTLINEAELW